MWGGWNWGQTQTVRDQHPNESQVDKRAILVAIADLLHPPHSRSIVLDHVAGLSLLVIPTSILSDHGCVADAHTTLVHIILSQAIQSHQRGINSHHGPPFFFQLQNNKSSMDTSVISDLSSGLADATSAAASLGEAATSGAESLFSEATSGAESLGGDVASGASSIGDFSSLDFPSLDFSASAAGSSAADSGSSAKSSSELAGSAALETEASSSGGAGQIVVDAANWKKGVAVAGVVGFSFLFNLL